MKHFIYAFAIATLALTPLMGEDQENSGTEATEQVAEPNTTDQLLACDNEENVDVEVASSYPRPVRGACKRCNRTKS